MIDLILPIFSTALGIGGAFLQRKHERKMFDSQTERIRIEHAQELALTEMQMRASREETEQELALTEIAGNVAAFAASQAGETSLSDIKYGDSKLGDAANFLRAVTRPGLTWMLVIATMLRARGFYDQVEGFAGIDAMDQAYKQMLNNPFDMAMISLTTLCVGWWFGSRGSRTSFKDDAYTRS